MGSKASYLTSLHLSFLIFKMLTINKVYKAILRLKWKALSTEPEIAGLSIHRFPDIMILPLLPPFHRQTLQKNQFVFVLICSLLPHSTHRYLDFINRTLKK